jgi:formylglycine-generating enzyme required for sulfatase activity
VDLSTGAAIAGIIGAAFVILFGGRSILDLIVAARKRKEQRSMAGGTSTALGVDEYRLRVEQSHTRLRFGDPTSTVAFPQDNYAATQGISLADIYTPLSVATEFGVGEPKNVRPVQLRIPVDEALTSADARRAVVLGDPGAGKSTLVDYLVGAYLRDHPEGIPVHVRLSEIPPINPNGIWAGVLEVHGSEALDPVVCSELEAVLVEHGGLLLLDGLDEVPSDSVAQALGDVLDAGRRFPKAQLIVTCRSYDYYLPDPPRQLPAEFTKWRLLPFTLDDMLSYVDRWYEALGALKFISAANERKRNLQDSLRNSPDLEGLAATPLLLALMALVHTTEGELPSARSVLYYKAVAHLLADSPQWRARFVTETIRLEEMFTIATEVAFEVQTREIQAPAVRFVGLSIDEIDSVVKADLRRRKFDESDHFKFRIAIDARVKRVVQSNGLLIEQAAGHFHFAHRSLQEFLAGAYLLNGADYELALRLASNPQWHEPLVLMAGYGSREARSLFFLTKFIEDLASTRTESLDRLLLAGEMLAEIGQDTLRSQRFARLVTAEGEGRPLWWQIVDDLVAAQEGLLQVSERIQLLQVLGRLGDPRFVDSSSNPTPLSSRLVALPAIQISIGDDGRNRPRAKSELVATAPSRRISLDSFRVAKYLTTNYEFRYFVEDGGYTSHEWWSLDGLSWLSGDSGFAAELESRTVEWIHRDFKAELEMGKFRMEDVLRDAAAMSRPRTEPFYWRNARYNQNNQPLVGVNWWEANAYCRWLTGSLVRNGSIGANEVASIPNEWQWERYARGVDDHRVFPWGSDEDTTQRAHTRFDRLDLDAATPVGAFPLGKTFHGLLDVAGNVWEWTSSRALPMSVHHDRDRHRVDSVTDVVVRGGSWFSDVDGAVRCGYRGIDLPQNVYYDVGVRIVVTTASGGR